MTPGESRLWLVVYPRVALFTALLSQTHLFGALGKWQSGDAFRFLQLAPEQTANVGFKSIDAATAGITFSNTIPLALSITNQPLLDGSGVAAGDVDGDGRCDLYFCAINGHNRLYRNEGNWHFEETTDTAGVACEGLRSTGAALVDLDGDGDLDLVVNTAGNDTRIFYNDGRGRFNALNQILNPHRGGKSLAIADVDGDGWLDLYLANYRVTALMDAVDARFTFKMVDGKQTVATYNARPTTDPDLVDRFSVGPRGDFQENGEPDVLLRNNGGTNFTPVSFTSGSFLDEDGKALTKAPTDWGLAAAFHDINGDGLPDLYVCNDFQTPDRLWLNQGSGRFRLAPKLAQRHTSISSMSVDFADINLDGDDDFMVLDMMSRRHADRMRFMSVSYALNSPPGVFDDRPQYELNTLFLNRGDGTCSEIAQMSGLQASDWSWSVIFLDVDLDGWPDVLISTGMERDGRDLDVAALLKSIRSGRQPSEAEILKARAMYPRHAEGTMAFRNRKDLTFEDTTERWGFAQKGVCNGMALADLDNDGDMDVVLNCLNGPVLLFRNDTSAPRVAVKLKGQTPNTAGIGARISVRGGPVPVQSQEMISGGRYLSCDEAMRTFAAAPGPLTIEVTWRDGRKSLLTNVLANRIYEVDESRATTVPHHRHIAQPQPETSATGLFDDMTPNLAHTHQQRRFDDFARQPLLPNRLSQLGPGVCWFDLDGDGKDDLVIGGGSGGEIGVFLNRGKGTFEKGLSTGALPRTQSGLVGWMPTTNSSAILIGASNYEDGRPEGAAVCSYHPSGSLETEISAWESSVGPLALADLDGNGTMVLFVGGRVVAGRFPEAASSRLYRHNQRNWLLDQENSKVLNQVGLVAGAVFTDLSGDGLPELALSCEWGPLRFLRNEGGRLVPWDPAIILGGGAPALSEIRSLSQLVGWWTGITAGDFDGDGRLDLAVGNWGRNTPYEAYRPYPISLYYGDLGGDDSVQLVEAYVDPYLKKTVPLRPLNSLARGLPWLRGQYESYRDFSTASVQEMLGERRSAAKVLQANWLESAVLLNRGDRFEVRPLPSEAQFAPAFALCAADFDGDGHEDLFLSQNFFATQPETVRYDGGRGLMLRGLGDGNFRAMSAGESGLKVYGEQRGAAVCDFDADGRADLVVTQNGAQTRLFHNVHGRPGIRVRLRGETPNPLGYGAVLQTKQGDKWGSAREIHAGSGYWSQDSATQVLPTISPNSEIQVRWPGGKSLIYQVPVGATEVELRRDGTASAQ